MKHRKRGHHTSKQQMQEDPDLGLAIVSLALPVFFPLPFVSLILAIVAQQNSTKRGYKNTLAKASVYFNAILTVAFVLLVVLLIIAGMHSDSTSTGQSTPMGSGTIPSASRL